MKVSIQALGSLGDVMPYISTALALKNQGAEVSLLAPKDFSDLIASHGIEVAETAAFSLEGWMIEAAERGTLSSPVSFFRDWSDMIQPHINDVMERSLTAATGADIVVANLICAPARVAAEAHGLPFLLNAQQPVLSPTSEAPCAMIWRPWMGQGLNRISYQMIKLSNWVIGRTLAKHRKRLGLKGQPGFADLRSHLGRPLPKVTTVPWPLMASRPQDWRPEDELLAYPSLPAQTGDQLDPNLRAFLENGPPPVYLGLGSLGSGHGKGLLEVALDGLNTLGQRAIVSASMMGEETELGEAFHVAGHIAHDQVFPRCAAVIHHGGAGTTDTCLRAGVPQVIQPHFLDQFWFAEQLKSKAVAPPALPTKRLSADRFASTLEAALSPEMKARALELQSEALNVSGADDFVRSILVAASTT